MISLIYLLRNNVLNQIDDIAQFDEKSLEFLESLNVNLYKIASMDIVNLKLIKKIAQTNKPLIISCGMSTLGQVEDAVNTVKETGNTKLMLLHCNSSYPMNNEDANLSMIKTLRDRYGCDVGYSGHEKGLQISLAASVMGATSIERHITLDRTMYGSDQSASIEPAGLTKLIRDIRDVESAIGDGVKKMTDVEVKCRKKLANPHWVSLNK